MSEDVRQAHAHPETMDAVWHALNDRFDWTVYSAYAQMRSAGLTTSEINRLAFYRWLVSNERALIETGT